MAKTKRGLTTCGRTYHAAGQFGMGELGARRYSRLMGFINGLLNIGTALSGIAVATPPAGTNYAAQPVTYEMVSGGIALNTVSCVFGPPTGATATPWGTISVWGITDPYGNSVWAGTMTTPFSPQSGELVVVPAGSMNLITASGAIGLPLLGPYALAGNPTGSSGAAQSITLDPTLTLTSGGVLSVTSGMFIMANEPIPPYTGALSSGVVSVSSGSYSLVLQSGVRNALILQNQDPNSTISLYFGGTVPPTGAVTPAYEMIGSSNFPPPGIGNFVLNNSIWAISTGLNSALTWLQG